MQSLRFPSCNKYHESHLICCNSIFLLFWALCKQLLQHSLTSSCRSKSTRQTCRRCSPFPTHPDCSSWEFSKQWKDLGYHTECMDNAKVKQMVASYCEHRPREIIQYADIARHLILYENGGWYVHSDVRPTPRCGVLQSFPQTTFGLESDFATKTQADNEGMLQQSLSLWAIYGVREINASYRMHASCHL